MKYHERSEITALLFADGKLCWNVDYPVPKHRVQNYLAKSRHIKGNKSGFPAKNQTYDNQEVDHQVYDI